MRHNISRTEQRNQQIIFPKNISSWDYQSKPAPGRQMTGEILFTGM